MFAPTIRCESAPTCGAIRGPASIRARARAVHVRQHLHTPILRQLALHAGQPRSELGGVHARHSDDSTINTPMDYATSSPYYSAFAQEAWRATPKLTVNLGLRFEFEQGMTEKATIA